MTRPRILLAGAIALLVAGFALLGVSGADVARGWLCAFVFIAMVPVGSLALLLLHGITGGRWGDDLAPILVPAARCTPLLFFGLLPVLLFRSAIYPWPAPDVPVDVARYYLNPVFFDVRALIALGVWSLLVWRAAWRRPLFAALGLSAHLVIMTFIPADWILTIQPHATSAAFGIGFGIEQIFAVLAFAAIVAHQHRDARAHRDLAGLLVSALLATVYFVYMQFLITWYGNIPDRVEWYVVRSDAAWPGVAFAVFLFGGALPFLALLSPAVRTSSTGLRVIGVLVLGGIALHVVWLIAPAFSVIILLPACLAVLLMAFLVAIAIDRGFTGIFIKRGAHGRP